MRIFSGILLFLLPIVLNAQTAAEKTRQLRLTFDSLKLTVDSLRYRTDSLTKLLDSLKNGIMMNNESEDFYYPPIQGLVVYNPRVFTDERGAFFESYNRKKFETAGIKADFVQENHSYSEGQVIRGMHYQLNPMAQAKLVRAVKGVIVDYALDLRLNSATFGHVFSITLAGDKGTSLFIPRGFAHGFRAVSDSCIVHYLCDNYYSKEQEAGCSYRIMLSHSAIVEDEKMIIADKDRALPDLGRCHVFERVI